MIEIKQKTKSNKKKLSSTPNTLYFETNKEFGEALGKDFIQSANKCFDKGELFLVGLAHGESPALAFKYILKNFKQLTNPELIRYTFTNSRLERQRDLEDVTDSLSFMRALLKKQYCTREQIFGGDFERDEMDSFLKKYNKEVKNFLGKNNKNGYDYVFVAADYKGRIAGITRNSTAFESKDIMTLGS